MNHYGAMARDHWQRWLPRRFQAIQDPDSFFSELGQEVATRIADLTLDLAGDDPPGEAYLTKAGRLNAARNQAEEIVLREQVLLPPEPRASEDMEGRNPEDLETGEPSAEPLDRPMVVRRGHPLWEQINAEQEELQEELRQDR